MPNAPPRRSPAALNLTGKPSTEVLRFVLAICRRTSARVALPLAHARVTAPETTWLGTWGPLQPTEAERRMDPRVVASDGDEVTVLYTTRAVAPDGERFESPVLGLYEVRDGKFARAQMFHYDTAAILAFLERAASSEGAKAAA